MIPHEKTVKIITMDKNSVITIENAFLDSNACHIGIELFDSIHQVAHISFIPNIVIIPLNRMPRHLVPDNQLVPQSIDGAASCIAISSMIDTTIIQTFTNINIPYFVVPHVIFRYYLEFLLNGQPITKEQRIIHEENRLKKAIAEYLQYIGVPVHLKGYQYICAAIFLLIKYPDDTPSITKVVYPTVAQAYKTTTQSVERAMRNAIGSAWDRSKEAFKNMYGCPFIHYCPTNNEFLALMREYFLREICIQNENMPSHELLA